MNPLREKMMFDYKKIWIPHAIGEGQTLDICLGSLRVWIHRGEQDWRIAHETDPAIVDRCSVTIADGELDAERDWRRWILDGKADRIQLKPHLPDRALIVRPEIPICLMPKQSVQLFISVPVWLGISFGSMPGQGLEVPTMLLSNSWFGPFTEGELCYALKTTAKTHHKDLHPSAHRAVFPLEVRNASQEKLNFERLCIRPQYVNIFQGETRLWTSKGRATYRGEENWSRIVYSSAAPGFDQATHLLGKARESIHRGAIQQTFDQLKQKVDL